jgi:acyl carrier protein
MIGIMERNEVLNQVNKVFIDVLDNAGIVLSDQTTANDIEEWDSLAHIHLIVALERTFNIHFGSKEIQSWENVGEMIDCICSKVS